MSENTCHLERPEWCKATTITKLLGLSRSTLYELSAKGEIRSISKKARGKKRGSRFFSYDSVKAWIESDDVTDDATSDENPNNSEPSAA